MGYTYILVLDRQADGARSSARRAAGAGGPSHARPIPRSDAYFRDHSVSPEELLQKMGICAPRSGGAGALMAGSSSCGRGCALAPRTRMARRPRACGAQLAGQNDEMSGGSSVSTGVFALRNDPKAVEMLIEWFRVPGAQPARRALRVRERHVHSRCAASAQ